MALLLFSAVSLISISRVPCYFNSQIFNFYSCTTQCIKLHQSVFPLLAKFEKKGWKLSLYLSCNLKRFSHNFLKYLFFSSFPGCPLMHYDAKYGLEHLVMLPLSPECWDYRCAWPHWVACFADDQAQDSVHFVRTP